MPPGQAVVVTDADLPGFTMTVPAGVRIIGWDGQPNSQVAVVAVPPDGSPLPPLPLGPGQRAGPIYLFSFGKVGGGLPTGNVVIDTANDLGALPGEPIGLYYFNEAPDGTAPNRWEQYGTGTVSADGTRIVTDRNPATGLPYGMPRFCCGARGNVSLARPSLSDQVRSRNAKGGEPVDLPTGRFTVRKTDLVLPGRLAVVMERTYRSENPRTGLLGVGWNLAPWESTLSQSGTAYLLTLADQSEYLLSGTGPGRWENQTEPALRGAVLSQVGGAFALRFKDGAVQRFDPIVGVANLWGLAAVTDRASNTVTVTRVAGRTGTTLGLRIASVTEPAGRNVLFSYDSLGRVAFLTDPLGRQVRYSYDPAGRVETVTDPAGGTTRYTYDGSHRILTITDPRGITFLVNEYEPTTGRVTRQTQADGGIWNFAYTVTGTAVTQTVVTNPRGSATTHRFNAAGFPLVQTDALGQPTSFEYAPGSNLLLSTTDSLGRVTRYTYDAQGSVTQVIDPAGNARTFTYEPTFNRVTSITDPLNNVTRFEYDAQGNLTAVVDPLSNRTTLAYNAAGQVTSTTDPLNQTTTLTYDSAGNLATIADPLGHTTRRSYDAASRLIQQTDPRGQVTRFAYNALNGTAQILDPLGGLTRMSYDGNGNLLTVTDARTNTTTHTYDSMDRLQTRTDPVGATERFEYDGVGNLTRQTDRKGQVATFSYDGLNRRSGATYADSTTSVIYDAGGRLIQASDTQGGTILNRYDALDRLLAQETVLGAITYQYDVLGRRTTMQAPSQAPTTYTYDPAYRLTQIVQGSQGVTFQYDNAGRRVRLTLPNQVSTEYQYDTASRLTALIYRNATGQLGDLTYQYDPAGNRTRVGGSFARTLLPAPVASATYDAANRQLSFAGQSLSYDLNGNLVDDGTATYSWDARNRLATLTGAGTTASFQYDPVERRTNKTINGTTTGFLYDGLNAVQELTGATAPATLLTGLAIDEYLTRTDSTGAQQHFVTDALGSTVALADPAATLQTQYSYEPFGTTSVMGAISSNPFQYTGRETDGTGLYYYRARYYHPVLRRFIAEDPLGFGAHGFNLYTYVLNQPTGFSDPLGTDLFIALYRAVGGANHIGIGINTTDTVGFYSNPSPPLPSSMPFLVPGQVVLDRIYHPEGPIAVIRITTDADQDKAALDSIIRAIQNPGNYNLGGRNCSEFVSGVMTAARVPSGSQLPWIPNELFDSLSKRYPSVAGPFRKP
jgi:RHS repeat-associated protein